MFSSVTLQEIYLIKNNKIHLGEARFKEYFCIKVRKIVTMSGKENGHDAREGKQPKENGHNVREGKQPCCQGKKIATTSWKENNHGARERK